MWGLIGHCKNLDVLIKVRHSQRKNEIIWFKVLKDLVSTIVKQHQATQIL